MGHYSSSEPSGFTCEKKARSKPETPTAEKPHQRFTAQGTAYMRNLTREQLYQGPWIAVHHQEPPRKTERGTSFSMRFPVLIVADYVENPEEMAQKVARILEAHWDDDDA